jgi:hypothetical protein
MAKKAVSGVMSNKVSYVYCFFPPSETFIEIKRLYIRRMHE